MAERCWRDLVVPPDNPDPWLPAMAENGVDFAGARGGWLGFEEDILRFTRMVEIVRRA